MSKATLSDLSNLQNEQTAVSAINANNTVIENAFENTLSRNGQTPNHMTADLDMNSNNIINLPTTTIDGNAISYGQVIDLIDSLENGAVITAPFVVMSSDLQLTDERVLTAGANIGITDGGAGSTVTIGIAGEDLNAYEALSTTGLVSRTGDGTVSTRTLTGPASGISVTDGDGVAGNPTLALTNDLAALEGLSTNGIVTRTATDTATTRTITGTANEITLTNGDGVSGNPTVSIPAAVTFTGKTITGGTFSGPTITSPTLTVRDNVFTIQDQTDNTKQLQLEASAITTATTRTLVAPDANTTIVGTDAAQILTNKTFALGSNNFSGTTAQFNTALSDNDFTTLAGTETLTNKTLTSPVINTPTLAVNDSALTIRDQADTTKVLQFEVSGVSTGTTRTLTVPNASTTIVGTDATQTLTNKTLTSPVITSPNLNMGSDAQGDVLYHNGTQYVRLGPGTSGHFLKTNGAAANPAWAAVPGGGDMLASNNLSDVASVATSRVNLSVMKHTLQTPIATTSGTQHSFTIPSGTKAFEVMFQGTSTNGTGIQGLQLGDSGGLESSGYNGTTFFQNGSTTTNLAHSTYIPHHIGNAATTVLTGTIRFVLSNSSTNTWNYYGIVAQTDAASIATISGYKSLSAELTTVTLLNTAANTWDAGAINVLQVEP